MMGTSINGYLRMKFIYCYISTWQSQYFLVMSLFNFASMYEGKACKTVPLGQGLINFFQKLWGNLLVGLLFGPLCNVYVYIQINVALILK
jgi:hypothetical protein